MPPQSLGSRCYKVNGIVQGVGFRPFVFRLARSHQLKGWVCNDSHGVTIEVEGPIEALDGFAAALASSPPPLAVVQQLTLLHEAPFSGRYTDFTIRESVDSGGARTLISPDTAVCERCLQELFEPSDRRYRYPFINCTDCGPRYTIIQGVPYDRPLTTMARFTMCDACATEYRDPLDRRFHAQPNACWACGPRVTLVDREGRPIAADDPIREAVALLRRGHIVAVKSLGGYHLMADPTNEAAVAALRTRKQRRRKPFALMAETVDAARRFCRVGPDEERLLASTERPIVLVEKLEDDGFSPLVAPATQEYGVMLASAPLHHLLLRDNFRAVIATSGNVTDEPIAFQDEDAMRRLSDIADFYLTHDREIHTRVDDSILRWLPMTRKPYLVRRARGFVPRPILHHRPVPSVLALGSALKNTICLNDQEKFFLSHHIGDLENLSTFESMVQATEHLSRILNITPQALACDLHPDFLNTRYALEQERLPVFQVQHHHAHMAACMFENGLQARAIGVVFDGVGHGSDGKAWGGEFLIGDYTGFERVAHLRYFPLLGGDRAVKEPDRIALAFLFELYGGDLAGRRLGVVTRRSEMELSVLLQMARRRINAPLTSSMGRLFDAVSAWLGICERVEYEGQAAIELEQMMPRDASPEPPLEYRVVPREGGWEIDVLPLFAQLIDVSDKEPPARLSVRFHETVVAMAVDVCARIRERYGLDIVVLSGGVFLNRYLVTRCLDRLRANGFQVFTHSTVPATDGGIALGQAVVAAYRLAASSGQQP